ncbi:MAG: hypothetical protein GY765_12440, partial [bacterium]|nr:hypothetical protein [bacterium]
KTDGTFDGRLGGDAAWGGGSRDEGGPATLPNMAALRQGTANSVRILISDFMFPSGLENFLFTAGRNASALIVIRVLAQIEREPHFYGGFRFFDAANPRLWKDLRVDPDSVTRYKDRLHAHLEILGQACRKMRAITINLDVPDSFSGLQAVQDAVTLPLMEKGLVGIY